MNVTNFRLIIYSKIFSRGFGWELRYQPILEMRFLRTLSIERPWVVSPCTWRLRSDHFLPIGAQSRLVMQFSALDWPADSGSELEGTVLVGGLVSMGVSVVPEASESGAGWLDVVLSLDSAPLPLTVSPTCNVHLKIETLKLSCNPWRLARLSSS